MKDKIWLSSPHMGGEELKFVREAFDTNWISPVGPHISAFETELAAYNNIPFAAALSSGTAAIHLALIMLGVKAGDEVICSSFTFSGSCNPIVYQQATPIFVDSETTTWNIDPEMLEEAIKGRIRITGKKPKAIILVHLYGMPANVMEVVRIANAYEIPLIEDAAEALGSKYQDQKLGTFGVMGIYSFNGNKIITTSGGGALVSNNSTFISKAKFLSTQARDNAPHYEHSEIGYNYRLSNVCAAIGRGQLKVLDERIAQRRRVYEKYLAELSSLPIQFLEEPPEMFSNRWLTTILFESFDKRELVRVALETENIESRPLWKPMHLQPVFNHSPYYGRGVSDKLFEAGLCLPSGSNLASMDQERVISAIKALF